MQPHDVVAQRRVDARWDEMNAPGPAIEGSDRRGDVGGIGGGECCGFPWSDLPTKPTYVAVEVSP